MIIYSRTVRVVVKRDRGMLRRITVTRTPTWLGRALGVRERVEEYIGSCTVWQRLPTWERADSGTEGWLASVEAEWNYEQGDAK